ncbi:MAG: tRNA guanosine(34) transglycosylase Tgt, partial [bacterium]
MKFEISARDGNARAGLITTSRGRIQTPAFMPCGTRGAVKAVRWEELEELGYELVLMNALHLYLRPGVETIESLGGVGKFSGWKGSILTDSGGYQFFSLKGLYEIDDEGVNFRSPYDGSFHRFTPETVMELQIGLGADIVVPLDECASGDAPKNKVLQAGERTLAWLARAKRYFDSHTDENRALFGIVQGGTDIDLRKKFLEKSAGLDLAGYAMGGISVGEDKNEGDRIV